jgi:hypothetical protein
MPYHHRGDCPYYPKDTSSNSTYSPSIPVSHSKPSTKTSMNYMVAETLCSTFCDLFLQSLSGDSGAAEAKAAEAAALRAKEIARIKALIARQVEEEALARAKGNDEWAACLGRHKEELNALEASWNTRIATLIASLKVPDFDSSAPPLTVNIPDFDGRSPDLIINVPGIDGSTPPLAIDAPSMTVDPLMLKISNPLRPSLAIKPPPPLSNPTTMDYSSKAENNSGWSEKMKDRITDAADSCNEALHEKLKSMVMEKIKEQRSIPYGPGAEDRKKICEIQDIVTDYVDKIFKTVIADLKTNGALTEKTGNVLKDMDDNLLPKVSGVLTE